MKIFLIALFNFLFIINLFAQNKQNETIDRCQTMQALQSQLDLNKVYRSYYNSVYNSNYNRTAKRAPLKPVVVPVAFHFSADVISCAQQSCLIDEVEDQLNYLNEAFGDNSTSNLIQNCTVAYEDSNGNSVVSTGTNISFCYATPPAGNGQELDPYCDPPITIGSFDGGKFAKGGTGAPGWDNILNIFIISDNCLGVADGIPGKAIADGVTVCATAFGGIDGTTCNLGTDPYFGLGKTLVHEIGHYFGLFHTFQGACDDEPNSPGPYNVDDTPPIAAETSGCPIGCNTSCGDVVASANFMDYADDACMGLFSIDQALVMNYWANTLFGASQFNCNDKKTLTALNSVCNNNNCTIICPSIVNSQIDIVEQYCGAVSNLSFPNPKAFGLSLNADSNGEVFTWSVNNYLSQGGTIVNTPFDLNTTDCTVTEQTYYLNIECYNNANAAVLSGGTFKIEAYPAPINNLSALVNITNENTCGEPQISPITGCEDYISITAATTNPSFPINSINSSVAKYTINFISNPNGPNCCDIPDLEGELLENGDFELGAINWIETEEAPPGTLSSSLYGIIGTSFGTSFNLNGSSDAWFGGFGNNTLLSLEQNIDIPPCGALSLLFDYKTDGCTSTNDIIFSILINNVNIATLNCDDATNGNIVTYGPIDIPNNYLGNVTIRLEALEEGINSYTNFLLDNISLIAKDCPEALSCNEEISTNYNCTNTTCDFSLNLTGSTNTTEVFRVEKNIISTAIINANVSYLAGELITLNSGFNAGKNFDFVAKIENCN